jgi:long-chain acyl-CoA synthetase
MATEAGRIDVRAALRGERIFITGATGFIGKVLVEKLLWSVPEVGKLVLLVRSDGERSADQRLREELLDSPVMARLRALHVNDWESWVAEKIEVVAGDLARDHFGLEAAAYSALAGRVDRVVASAATVTFDEQLDRALELNTRGARRALTLARDAGDVPLVQVSTCFVSGRRTGAIEERVAELGAAGEDLDAALAALDAAVEQARAAADPAAALVWAGAEQAAHYGFHDVYTLTKALGERLIERDRGAVPVVIVRPAIVESAVAEPIPGWIDAVRVADPLLVAYGRGRTREFAGTADSRLEIVPVDFVVNAIVAALAELQQAAGEPGRAGDAVRVYQVGSSRHPITLGGLVEHAREGFARTPLRDEQGDPIPVPPARFVEPLRYRHRLLARYRRAAARARQLGASRRGRRQAATERTLGHFVRLFEVYSPYLGHDARYEDTQTRALAARLSVADRARFPFDIAALDWPSYIRDVHVPGLVRFALRADSGAPPPPRLDDAVALAHARGEYPAAQASTLCGLFETAAAADPDTVAFQTYRQGRWLRYTYGQALTATANIAARLASRNRIGRGDRVVLWGAASPEWVLTWLAVHRLGAAVVPLDPQWPAAEVEAAARLTEAKLLCAAPALVAKLAGAAIPVAELAAPFVPEPDVGLLPGADGTAPAAEAGDLAFLFFTSGTTVAPKAVPLTHDNLMANVRDLVPVMRLSRQRLLSVLPIHHVFELMVGHLVPLAGGGTISYVAEIKPAEINWMMNATRPTMLVAVPRLLELLHNGIRQSVAAGGPMLGGLFKVLFTLSAATGGRYGHRLFGKVHRRFGGSLRRIATGGSALDPALGRRFQLMGFEVAEGYGMTETSPVLTVNPWGEIRFGSVGRPLPGVEVELRPVEGAAAGSDKGSGEIWVRGANVMAGYYRNPEATAEAMADGWLNTGDIGHFDGDGYLHISGRTKEVIVTSAGKNVYPEEVEGRYAGVPGVQELVVLGLPGRAGGEQVSAVVVPRPGASDEEIEQIRAAINARSAEVPSYQRITRIEFWRGELPKTTTMKVKRGRLAEALLAGERGGPASAAPPRAAEHASAHSAEEAWVLETLARLSRTRLDTLQPSDRLAELGVDSLTRVELVAELEGHLGVPINDAAAASLGRVQDLFDLVR